MGPMTLRTKRLLFLLLILGIAFGLGASAASFSQRQTRLRGALDGFPDPSLPPRVPALGVNADLTQYNTKVELAENLDLMRDTGFVWVRQAFAWGDIEQTHGNYDWSIYDRIVEEATQRNLRIVAVLWHSPDWAASSPTAPPDDLADFANFASTLAERYGDRIDIYQLWDEPNLTSGWGNQRPDAVAYMGLLESGYESIHAVDPDALVLTAGLAPTIETGPDNISDVLFLRALYENGAAPFFDGVAGKPYGFYSGPDDRRIDLNILNFSRFVLLREEMVKHGDSAKPLWASHFGWNTLPADWEGQPSAWGLTDPGEQAARTIAAYDRALNEWPWAGALILESWQPNVPPDDPHLGFALRDKAGALSLTAEAIREHSELYNTALWPGIYLADPTEIPQLNYSGLWEYSDLGADIVENGNSAIDVPVAGQMMGVITRRDNYRAYLYVDVNGQPSDILPQDKRGTYAVLTSADYQPHIEIIPLADGLVPRQKNMIHIEADRGWDQWAIVGYAIGSDVDTHASDVLSVASLLAVMICTVFAMWLAPQIGWSISLRRTAARMNATLNEGVHLALSLAAALAFWLGAALTWGGLVPNLVKRIGDGPSLLVTALTAGLFYFSEPLILVLIALILLFILIYARLSSGLVLMMFFTPYYLMPRPLFDRAFSLVEVISLLTLVAWGIHIVAERKEKGWPSLAGSYAQLTGLDKSVILFVSVSAVSLVWAELKGVAFTELRQMVIEPVVMYLVLRTTLLARSERWRIVDMLILTGAIITLYGFYQLITGTGLITAEGGSLRMRSVFGTPNNLALYLERLIPITAAIVLIGSTHVRRWLYGVAGLLMLVACVLTLSKGGLLLGIPAALALVVILWAGKAGLIAVGAGILTILVALIPLSRHPRFQSLFEFEEGSSFFRVQLWQSALRMIADHPITGVGLDQFLYLYRSKYILPDAWQQPDLSQPHNFLLNYWLRLGLIGLAAGIWLQVAFWRLAWRVRRAFRVSDPAMCALAVGLMGSMAAFIAHGLVDEVHFVIDLAFIFYMTLGLMHQMGVEAQEAGDASRD
jgi:O-antigen ligase